LLLQLDSLRKSICFQSLFVPGVCCPESKPGNNALVAIINQLAGGSNNNNNNNNNNNRVTTTTTTKRPTTIDYDSLTSPVTFAPTTTRPFQTFLNPIVSSGSQSQGVQPKGTGIYLLHPPGVIMFLQILTNKSWRHFKNCFINFINRLNNGWEFLYLLTATCNS
jgi:hypothetical protein